MWKSVAALGAAWALSAGADAATVRCDLTAADATGAGAGCQRAWMDRNLRLNDLVTVGTHNSYKTQPPDAVLALVRKVAAPRRPPWRALPTSGPAPRR